MANPSIVRVDRVSKQFTIRKDKSLKERLVNARRGKQHAETFRALSDISLDIAAGSTVGLIGANGSGKSTLLKTIGGIIQPTTGTVLRRGRMAALLELGAGFHPDLTGRENVFLNASILGLSEKQTLQYFDAIVDFSGIEDFIDTQVKFYSSGMYVRLAFAVAVHVDPDLLLVDEVLAVGDEAFQSKCLDKIRSFQLEGRTIVLVTHTLSQITDLCTRGIVLSDGGVVFDGAPDDAVKVLRAGYRSTRDFEEARRLEAEIEASKPRLEHVDIEAIRLVDASGAEIDELTSGDDVAIEVDVNAHERVDAWRIGLSIANAFGQVAIFTSTERLGLPEGPLEGRRRVRFDLPDARIGSGTYAITAAVERPSVGELARAQDAVTFHVAQMDRSVGLASTDLSVALVDR